MTVANPFPVDLADPQLYRSARRYDMWRDFVSADQVVWSPPGKSPTGFYSVFSHAACSQVLAPNAPFTSEYGMMIGFDRDHPDKAGQHMLVVAEGDRHSSLRRLIGPFLSRASASSLQGFVEREVAELLVLLRTGADSNAAVQAGSRLPAAVVCEILGVPDSDRELVITLTNHAFGGEEPSMADMSPSEAHAEILSYFVDIIADHRRHQRSDLVAAMIDEGTMDDRAILMNCDNVLIGGNETTRHAVTGAFHALATAGDLLPRLRAGQFRIEQAVEEILRWTSPAMHVLRVATRDVTVAGQKIAEGTPVVAWLPAANRDPRMFTAPDVVRADRHPNRHLTFGHGPHHCLGAALARVELGVLLTALTAKLEGLEIAGVPQWMSVLQVQGYSSLPLTFQWR
ncbi:hydroxylation protein CepL [Krasilnikovia cinnamomea]|uniref:Hydroxylation protein CepL n=1 Tax=Krasilnikovia cinnamomea TaxID=349313 RepID=A0A4Q7ZQ84_9ACTN|nr:cytochrome P450 [Krasilnikovia cinnamomea]RZU53272.1 hydroxylation protein CepL [Krasilnikovia cinnamomea]